MKYKEALAIVILLGGIYPIYGMEPEYEIVNSGYEYITQVKVAPHAHELLQAIQDNQVSVVKTLLEKYPSLANEKACSTVGKACFYLIEKAFEYASFSSKSDDNPYAQIIRLFGDHGFDFNTKMLYPNYKDYSFLAYAVNPGEEIPLVIVKALVESGARPDDKAMKTVDGWISFLSQEKPSGFKNKLEKYQEIKKMFVEALIPTR